MIFSPAKDETKTFRIEYVLKNVAIAHTDIGELYYQLIGESNTERIDYFEAAIHLPEINKDDVKIFAHGPLNGENLWDIRKTPLDTKPIIASLTCTDVQSFNYDDPNPVEIGEKQNDTIYISDGYLVVGGKTYNYAKDLPDGVTIPLSYMQ